MQDYLASIPGARNRLLQVESLLPVPEQVLKVGDIIDKVNGKSYTSGYG